MHDEGTTSRLTRTASDGGETQAISLGYDGALLTEVAWDGPARGRYRYRYDDHWRLVGISLDDGVETAMAGDADGLTTRFGPFRIEGNPALRWALALPMGMPAGSVCHFTGTLTPAGGKAVIFVKTSTSDTPAPGTVQPSFFAQHPTLHGDLFLHVDSECSWAVTVVRLPL